jgi:hypothetical protein
MIGVMSANMGGPMNLGQMLDAAFSIYRRHFLALVGSVAVIVVPLAIAELALGQAAPIAAVLLSLLPAAAAACLVDQAAAGQKPTVATVWSALTPNVVALILTAAMFIAGVFIGLLLFIVPGIVLWIWWALAAPVIAVEHRRYASALGRSRELVSGSWWRVFGILLVIVLMAYAVVVAVGALLGAGGGNGDALSLSSSEIILNTVIQLIISPYIALITALLYFDLRNRREGSDIARGLDALDPPPPAEGR